MPTDVFSNCISQLRKEDVVSSLNVNFDPTLIMYLEPLFDETTDSTDTLFSIQVIKKITLSFRHRRLSPSNNPPVNELVVEAPSNTPYNIEILNTDGSVMSSDDIKD